MVVYPCTAEAEILVKRYNFCRGGNIGWSDTSLDETMNSAHPKTSGRVKKN